MNLKNIFFLCLLFLFLLNINACDKNPVKPVDQEIKGNSSIFFVIKNIEDEPIAGIKISISKLVTNKFNVRVETDSSGNAAAENLPSGNYRVIFNYINIPDNGNMIFNNEVSIADSQILKLDYVIPSSIDLCIGTGCFYYYDGDEYSHTFSDIHVLLEPGNYEAVTDQKGFVTFKNIPVKHYKLTLSNLGISLNYTINQFNFANGVLKELNYWYQNNKPQIKILSPDNNHFHGRGAINFICEANDFEDGVLSDSSVVWYSDIDGRLGYGKNFRCPYLSVGKHKIKLLATDSCMGSSETDIYLNVENYETESFYPFPTLSYWDYVYSINEITVNYSENISERWILKGLKAITDAANTRTCTMDYEIVRDDETRRCTYSVIDKYKNVGEDIFVTETFENMKIYLPGNTTPSESLYIETKYSPELLLIKNYLTIKTGDSYNSSVSANVESYYYNEGQGAISFSENKNISASYSAGENEWIIVPAGEYHTLPLNVNMNGNIKKWWLAKGIGIVKADYKFSGLFLSALLEKTNISDYSDSAKRSLRNIDKENIILNIEHENSSYLKTLKIAGLVRSLCPR